MTTAEYQKEIETILEHAGEHFLRVRFTHIRYLRGDGSAACVLAYILNQYAMKNNNDRDRQLLIENELFFICLFKNIRKHTRMSKNRLIHAINRLKTKKIIETKHGRGNILMMRVLPQKLEAIEEWDKSRNPEKGILEIPKREFQKSRKGNSTPTDFLAETRKKPSNSEPSKKLSKKPTNRRRFADDDIPSHDIFSPNGDNLSPAKRLTNLLHRKLDEANQIMRKPAKKEWEDSFASLLKFRSFKEIKEAIIIHAKNIHDKFWPKFRSAPSFCEGFSRVEDAIRSLEQEEEDVIN